MSLKVKCEKCNFNLAFNIKNPGLITVAPCESCMTHPEDLIGGTAGVTPEAGFRLRGSSAATTAFRPSEEVEGAQRTLVSRMDDTRNQDLGTDDGNDWRAEKER